MNESNAQLQPKPGICNASALCRVASPVFNKNYFSQCNADSDCSVAGTTDPSRPPRLLCCDEVAQTVATYCNGAPQASIDAYMQRGGWISTRCGPKPNCVSQLITAQASSNPVTTAQASSTPVTTARASSTLATTTPEPSKISSLAGTPAQPAIAVPLAVLAFSQFAVAGLVQLGA